MSGKSGAAINGNQHGLWRVCGGGGKGWGTGWGKGEGMGLCETRLQFCSSRRMSLRPTARDMRNDEAQGDAEVSIPNPPRSHTLFLLLLLAPTLAATTPSHPRGARARATEPAEPMLGNDILRYGKNGVRHMGGMGHLLIRSADSTSNAATMPRRHARAWVGPYVAAVRRSAMYGRRRSCTCTIPLTITRCLGGAGAAPSTAHARVST